MTKKKSKIISKSTVKLKGKDGGNFTEKLKSKSYISNENSASKLKQSLKNEKAKSSIKSFKKNPDGTYTLSKGKDGGAFTEKKISKLRGRLLMKRYKRKQN